jgi:hypothetical protein
MKSRYQGSDNGGREISSGSTTDLSGVPLAFSDATTLDVGMTFSGSDSATTQYTITSVTSTPTGNVETTGSYSGSMTSKRNCGDRQNASLRRSGAVEVYEPGEGITVHGYTIISQQSNRSSQTTEADRKSELDANGEWQTTSGTGRDTGTQNSESYLATRQYLTAEQTEQSADGTMTSTTHGFTLAVTFDTYAEDDTPDQTISDGNRIVTNGENIIEITVDDSTRLNMASVYTWSPSEGDTIAGHLILSDETHDVMDATITETADADGERSTTGGSADAVSSGDSSTIMTQNDTAYTRNVPHGAVAGYYGSAVRNRSDDEFTSKLSLDDNEEWQVVSGEGFVAAGEETGVYFAGGRFSTVAPAMTLPRAYRSSVASQAAVSPALSTEPGRYSSIDENGFGNGSGYGVKVYYAFENGDWVETGENLLVTQNDNYNDTFEEGTEPFNLSNNEMSFRQRSSSGYSFNPIIELDTEAETILSVEALEKSAQGEGYHYSLLAPDGKNSDVDTKNYDDTTKIEYVLVLKENATGTDPATGKIRLEDYEWKVDSGTNVQTVADYKAQNRHVGDDKNYEKYKTTVDIDGEIYHTLDDVTGEWILRGSDPATGEPLKNEITTKVVDSVMKKRYHEEDSEITLFGETVTLKKIDEGHSNDTLEPEEITTAVAIGTASSGGTASANGTTGASEIDFVYRGKGTRRMDASGTRKQETSGSAIASYTESETEWIDRTIRFEIPENSPTNNADAWQIVSGEGKSGGERGWEFKFTPEKQMGTYASTALGYHPN